MRIITMIERIERIDQLIKLKATGTPQNLAKTLNISERCVFRTIKMMKALGAPIYYCNKKNSYCYEEEVAFFFGFKKKNHI